MAKLLATKLIYISNMFYNLLLVLFHAYPLELSFKILRDLFKYSQPIIVII